MKSVGVYEAKTHLPRLLEEVESGGVVTITRHGQPVARLVGARTAVDRGQVAEAVAALLKLRKKHTLGMPVRRVLEAGRK